MDNSPSIDPRLLDKRLSGNLSPSLYQTSSPVARGFENRHDSRSGEEDIDLDPSQEPTARQDSSDQLNLLGLFEPKYGCLLRTYSSRLTGDIVQMTLPTSLELIKGASKKAIKLGSKMLRMEIPVASPGHHTLLNMSTIPCRPVGPNISMILGILFVL